VLNTAGSGRFYEKTDFGDCGLKSYMVPTVGPVKTEKVYVVNLYLSSLSSALVARGVSLTSSVYGYLSGVSCA
jgi:hypothetical protein